MPTQWKSLIQQSIEQQKSQHLERKLCVRATTTHMIDVASNDYLSLSNDPRVHEAAIGAMKKFGTSSTGSALVSGFTHIHEECQERLAQLCGFDACLIFSSGYMANIAAVTALALASPDTIIISDHANHASLIDGCRLTKKKIVRVDCRDSQALETAIINNIAYPILIVSDVVYSTTGEIAPVVDIMMLADKFGCFVIFDEAHSFGVTGDNGAGVLASLDAGHRENVIVTATLSKAFASQGGIILCSHTQKQHIINTARTFIFDTAVAPSAVGAAIAVLNILEDDPNIIQQAHQSLERISTLLRDGMHNLRNVSEIDVPNPVSMIYPLYIGDSERAWKMAQTCRRQGVHVGCFRYPSVPRGAARLRLTGHAGLSEKMCSHISATLLGAIISPGIDE